MAKKEASLESRSDVNVNMTIPTSQTSAIPSTSAHGPTNSSANVDLGDLGVNRFQLCYLVVNTAVIQAILKMVDKNFFKNPFLECSWSTVWPQSI